MARISWAYVALSAFLCACDDDEHRLGPPPADASVDAVGDADGDADASAGDLGALNDGGAPDAEPPPPQCPPDMVLVLARTCVDRYETSLVDVDSERPLSAYYPPLKSYGKYIEARQAESERLLIAEPSGQAASTPFPSLPGWQMTGRFKAKAISRRSAIPNAYLNMAASRDACAAVGKRLCSLEEWQTACRGEQGRPFPYGDAYKQGVCNVFREDHPGRILFVNMTVGMLDPRMNKMTVKGKPLLRPTGTTPECKSTWGDDAIYDMVGNLDEWVDDPEGTFAGGFFSRSSKTGCERTVTAHPAGYFDYSTGGRCCAEPTRAALTP